MASKPVNYYLIKTARLTGWLLFALVLLLIVTGLSMRSDLGFNRLIDPTAGRMWVFGRETTSIKGADLRELRSDIGMIFQQFNLVRRHSVLANVLSGSLGAASLAKSLMMRFPQEEIERAQRRLEQEMSRAPEPRKKRLLRGLFRAR